VNKPALRLGLARDTRDQGVTGDAVADTGADGATAQDESAADQRAGTTMVGSAIPYPP
jgi:hypothetical protein